MAKKENHMLTPENFVPFWNALSETDQKIVLDNLQIDEKPGNGFFSSMRFMQGGLLFLIRGHIRIFLSSTEGREITVVMMDPTDNFLVHPGDAAHNRPGLLRFETSSDCKYAFLPKDIMTTVMAHSPAAMDFVLEAEDLLIRRLADSLSYAVFLPLRANLARTLLERSAFTGAVRLTHEELANELGTTRVVISRELKKLEEFGLIKLGRGEIEILYRDGLNELIK